MGVCFLLTCCCYPQTPLIYNFNRKCLWYVYRVVQGISLLGGEFTFGLGLVSSPSPDSDSRID